MRREMVVGPRGWCAAFVLLVSLVYPTVTLAQGNVVAVYVDGPDARAVRGVVVDALPGGTTLVSEQTFHAELIRQGQRGPFGKGIDPNAITRIRKAARVVGASAVVVARVRRDRTGRHVLLLVVDAWKDPASVAEVPIELKSHADDVDTVKVALGRGAVADVPPQERAAPAPETTPPAPAETPAAEAPPVIPAPSPPPRPAADQSALENRESSTEPAPRAAAPSTPAQPIAASVLDLSLGDEVAGRHFEYRNGIARGTRDYSVFPAPGVSVRGQIFPFAWRDIGLTAEYLRIFSNSNRVGSLAADLWPSSYTVGLRVRIHPGADPPFVLGLSVAYALTTFQPVGALNAELPNVTYRSVRPAIDARIPLGKFSVLAGAAVRAIVDPNDISTRFYGPSGHGFDLELGGALIILPKIELRLTGWYLRYAFTFAPQVGANFDAGGSVDELYGVRLAVAFFL